MEAAWEFGCERTRGKPRKMSGDTDLWHPSKWQEVVTAQKERESLH